MKTIAALLVVVLLTGCLRTNLVDDEEPQMAYVPIYASANDLQEVNVSEARPTVKAGKIYVYGKYIFQNEQYQGIHVIDNTDPAHPVKKAFISIPFNTELAVRANHLFVNCVNDLLVIDVADPTNPTIVSRTPNAFPVISQTHPPHHGYFVCPDTSKGTVVEWQLLPVNDAKCRR